MASDKTIALDFDGVLNNYQKSFTLVPKDKPVDGSLEFVNWLVSEGWRIEIFSKRSSTNVKGTALIHEWLSKNGFPVKNIKISYGKPDAQIFVDDRGYRFNGDFDSLRSFLSNPSNLTPWNRKE